MAKEIDCLMFFTFPDMLIQCDVEVEVQKFQPPSARFAQVIVLLVR